MAVPLVRTPVAVIEHVERALRCGGDLESMLRQVTEAAAELLRVERTSLRLLDESRHRLLLAARFGPSSHVNREVAFEIGQGLIGWIAARGEMICTDHAEADARFVHRPDQLAHLGAFLGVPLLDRDGAIGVLSASSPITLFSLADVRWLRNLAAASTPHLERARLAHLAVARFG